MGRNKKNDSHRKKSAKGKNMMKHKKHYGKETLGHELADKHKKKILYEYKKVLANEAKNLNEWSERVKKIYEEENSNEELQMHEETTQGKADDKKSFNPKQKRKAKPKKVSVFHKEVKELEKAHLRKELERQETQKRKMEKEEALERYREKKENTYRLLKKTNYKGQPFMGARIKLLLDKIQATNSAE